MSKPGSFPHGRNAGESRNPNTERAPQEFAGLILNAPSWHQLKAIIDFHKRGNLFETYAAASSYLDIGLDPAAPHYERKKALARAQSYWYQVLQDHFSKNLWLDDIPARCRVYLAHFTTYKAIADQRLPPRSTEDKTYQSMLTAGQEQLSSLYEVWNMFNDHRAKNTSHLLGTICETAVLLLLKRFSLHHMEEATWAVTPATFLQESGIEHAGGEQGEPWDISVFTAHSHSTEPALSYRIQVKTAGPKNTDSTIPTVYLHSDLTLPNSTGFTGCNIIEECLRESQGVANPQELQNLDLRTERLLDILDKE